MFTQFHANYPEYERKIIVAELANGESKLRILFVTVSFGIGIDIKRVIHMDYPTPWRSTSKRLDRVGGIKSIYLL